MGNSLNPPPPGGGGFASKKIKKKLILPTCHPLRSRSLLFFLIQIVRVKISSFVLAFGLLKAHSEEPVPLWSSTENKKIQNFEAETFILSAGHFESTYDSQRQQCLVHREISN